MAKVTQEEVWQIESMMKDIQSKLEPEAAANRAYHKRFGWDGFEHVDYDAFSWLTHRDSIKLTTSLQRTESASDTLVSFRMANDRSILGIAAQFGNISVAQIMLNHGAKVDQLSQNNTPLHHAICGGHADIAKLLLDRSADVNRSSSSKQSPLRTAVLYSRVDIAKLLLDKGVDVNESSSEMSLLGTAIHCRKVAVVKLLLDKGADVSKISSHSMTIHSREAVDITKLLLTHGVKGNLFLLQDAIHKAVTYREESTDSSVPGIEGVVELILTHGGVNINDMSPSAISYAWNYFEDCNEECSLLTIKALLRSPIAINLTPFNQYPVCRVLQKYPLFAPAKYPIDTSPKVAAAIKANILNAHEAYNTFCVEIKDIFVEAALMPILRDFYIDEPFPSYASPAFEYNVLPPEAVQAAGAVAGFGCVVQ